jgi:putative transcriptional regulator
MRGLALVAFISAIVGPVAVRAISGQPAEERITPGTLLVASEKLGDPNFEEAVVLITHRDDDGGVMGVVLNRPLEVTLAKAFPRMHANTDPVFEGGPVSPEAVQALLRSPEKPEDAEHVAGDVYSVVHKKLLEKSISDRLPSAKFRVYLGYAGWGPGQLENEIRMGSWVTRRGAKYAFDSDPESLWQRLDRESHSQVAQRRPQVRMEACRSFEPFFSR